MAREAQVAHARLGPAVAIGFQARTRCAHALQKKKAGTSGKMDAKSFVSRLRGSRRFLKGFVAGAVVGAAGAGLTALHFFRSQGAEAALAVREPEGKCAGWVALPRPGVGAELLPRA